MDFIIMFSRNDDLDQCASYLYRSGIAFEKESFNNIGYLAIPDTPKHIEDYFISDYFFLDFRGEETVAGFDKENTYKASVFSNAYHTDFPMAKDVYHDYLEKRDARIRTQIYPKPDIFCFGYPREKEWGAIEEIAPGITATVKHNLDIDAQCGLRNTIRCVYTPFNYGWNTKYICIVLPKEDTDTRNMQDYYYHVLSRMKQFAKNKGYKHIPVFEIHKDSMPMEGADIDEIAMDIFSTDPVAHYAVV